MTCSWRNKAGWKCADGILNAQPRRRYECTTAVITSTALRFSKGRKRAEMVSLISVISTSGIGCLGWRYRDYRAECRTASSVSWRTALSGWHAVSRFPLLSSRLIPGRRACCDRTTRGEGRQPVYIEFTGLAEKAVNCCATNGCGSGHQKLVSGIKPEFVADNAWADFSQKKSQIIPDGAAKSLVLRAGDWLTIMIPESRQHGAPAPKRIRLQVAGIFRLSAVCWIIMLLPLEDAQQYLDYGEASQVSKLHG